MFTLVLTLTLAGCGRDAVTEANDAGITDAGTAQTCGGIAGKKCPDTHICKDDPSDACDPGTATDCSGLCVAK